MKKDQVQIGRAYVAKVSGQLARVRIDAESRFGGWEGTNLLTHRKVRIKSAQRLRREITSDRTAGPVAAEPAVVQNDLPPQDIDERLAAAPPSIVPYEQRRARAEAAQAESADDDGPRYDPSRCATPRCRGTPVMTYLERPMCQACWDRHCEEDQPSEVSESAGDACRPSEEPQTPVEENAMSKKKSAKKQSTKKQTKAPPAAAKAKGGKKAAGPKAKATTANKPKRVSALDAAAQVLAKAGKPMRAQELIAAMAEQNLWKSPAGATPHATLYAAMMREERDKGGESRFRKVDRGQFEFAGKGK
ncbi:MAG: winged helix-turn-helix domain-containing protein [Phycisphaerae bacterium]|nr:winged helix-turn-helix domain-containing protein [Phycisphaerae bacterium]